MTNREAIKLLSEIRDSEYVKYMGIKTAVFNEKAIEAFDLAISALEKQEADRWTPVTEKPPEKEGCYLVTIKYDHERRYSKTAWYSGDGWVTRQDIIAWRLTPEPYKAEDET